jgi:hypothetical protein
MTGQPQSVKVEELQVRLNGGIDRGEREGAAGRMWILARLLRDVEFVS